MEISAKNQIRGKVKTVQHGQSYSQIAIEQTDANGEETGSFIHAAIPVDIAKKMKLGNDTKVIAIFPAATVIVAKENS